MIRTSEAFQRAIVDSPRQTELFAVVDISDPDKAYLPASVSPEAPWSQTEQLHDYEFDLPPRYASLERNRWLLDGSFDLFPDDYQVPERIGYASQALSGDDGTFSTPIFTQLNFENVRILQACSVFFSGDPVDGVAEEFRLEVFYRDQIIYTETVTGNTAADHLFKGFTVYDPTAVRLTVTRWTRPYRRDRTMEIIIGIYERWTNDMLASFSATLQGQFSCLSLPYGSVSLSMDNLDRRFEPRKKDSIFQSIEERQGIDLFIGVKTVYGVEKVKLGLFYQAGDGWKTSANEITMSWYLVDIIGLLCNRTFLVPEALPTTLEGWIRALVSQLGESFSERFHVDPEYANKPVTANSKAAVTGKKCGDILRWACQASGTWPRARQEDGALTAEPLWNEGNKYDLDNLVSYPTMKANRSLAALIFQLAMPPETDPETGETVERTREYVVSGNSTTSEETVTITNPFLHSTDQALAAARNILAQYGGNILELTGRGNPSSEIGDVDTIWLDESTATTARRMNQTFRIQDGVLQNCLSTLLMADGSYLWTEFEVFDADGYFEVPEGVTSVRVVIGQGGQGGGPGGPGWIGFTGNFISGAIGSGYGEDGADGQGGRIWYGVVSVNPGSRVPVRLGAGGAPGNTLGQAGAAGGHSTFGVYSSENGRVYENGYTDIANGQAFARTGVASPRPGTGDGGKGGKGGDPGQGYARKHQYHPPGSEEGTSNTTYELIVTKEPGPGHPGIRGGDGFVMVTWEKPAV